MRKKWMAMGLAMAMVLGLAACGNSSTAGSSSSADTAEQEESVSAVQDTASAAEERSSEEQADSEVPEADTAETSTEEAGLSDTDQAALVVYFSWSGNTESVANEIQAQTGADLFEIVPAEAYTDDYNALLDLAQEEQAEDARPAMAEAVENMDQYDVVYLGYPNWWGDMPMILYTFLDEYDLSGKTIAPFVTSGGSGLSGTVDAIRSLEPEAEVTDGLSLGSSEAADPGSEVTEWLAEIGLGQ